MSSLEERFWEKVDKNGPVIRPELGPCWIWSASTDGRGYGQIFDGHRRRAHRVSFEIHFGSVPNGLHVLHRCDVPACVNPAHLFADTHAGNMADKVLKGRQAAGAKLSAVLRKVSPKGERHCRAKMTASQVVEARARHAAGETIAALARELRVDWRTMACAVRRLTWRTA